VTRQHLIGELSVRLEQLQAVTRHPAREVANLRYQVETGPVSWLATDSMPCAYPEPMCRSSGDSSPASLLHGHVARRCSVCSGVSSITA
jgi:hypothetical protein